MEYEKIYRSIIKNRLENPLSKEHYGEYHHILPKSLGGSNDKENLVKLSAREHFICHALLAEMFERGTFSWYKMNHAFLMMKANTESMNRYINNRLYALKKEDFSKIMSYSQKGQKNSQFGIRRSEETKRKQKVSILKTLGVADGLTYRERKLIRKQKELEAYTVAGRFLNKQRRDSINKLFGINLEGRCQDGFEELTRLFENLYVKEGLSTLQLAKMFNTSNENIRNYLEFTGIHRRSLSQAIQNYLDKQE